MQKIDTRRSAVKAQCGRCGLFRHGNAVRGPVHVVAINVHTLMAGLQCVRPDSVPAPPSGRRIRTEIQRFIVSGK